MVKPGMSVTDPAVLAERVELDTSAVLVIDIQNDWCHEDGAYARAGHDARILRERVPAVAEFIAGVREAGRPLIHVGTTHGPWTNSPAWVARLKSRNIDPASFLLPGGWGSEFYGITPMPGEWVVIKHRFSAFVGTDLDLVLRTRGITTVVLTGCTTHVCVQNTAMHALMHNYHVVVVEDCTAAFTVEEHEQAIAYMGKLSVAITRAQTVLDCWAADRETASATAGKAGVDLSET
jgi:ureidoacrylate peracid hydrolase